MAKKKNKGSSKKKTSDKGKAKSKKSSSSKAKSGSKKKSPKKSSKKTVKKTVKNEAGLSKAFLDKMKKVLHQMREELSDNIESGLMELQNTEKHHLADAEDMASDSNDDILVSQILEMGSVKVREVDRALDKIEKGTYGVCEGNGENIPTARLEFLPHARLCIECKRLQEQGLLEGFDE